MEKRLATIYIAKNKQLYCRLVFSPFLILYCIVSLPKYFSLIFVLSILPNKLLPAYRFPGGFIRKDSLYIWITVRKSETSTWKSYGRVEQKENRQKSAEKIAEIRREIKNKKNTSTNTIWLIILYNRPLWQSVLY